MVCGLCASLAAVIDPSACFFLALLGGVILAYRWKWSLRMGGLLLFLIEINLALSYLRVREELLEREERDWLRQLRQLRSK